VASVRIVEVRPKYLDADGVNTQLDFEIQVPSADRASEVRALLLLENARIWEDVANLAREHGFDVSSVDLSDVDIAQVGTLENQNQQGEGPNAPTFLIVGLTAGVICGVAVLSIGYLAFHTGALHFSRWGRQEDGVKTPSTVVACGKDIEMQDVCSTIILRVV
jgi:hypothetical protein